MKLSHTLLTSALFSACAFYSPLSLAQIGTVSLGDKPDEGTQVRLGLVGVLAPRYPGGDQTRLRLWPSFAAYSSQGWFASVVNGIGWNFGNGKTIDYGVRLTYDLGRDENDSPSLRGMGDIKPRPEVGVFFNYDITRALTLKTSARYGAGSDNDGLLIDTALNFGFPVMDRTFGVVGLSTTYASANYMRTYFGVNPAQSLSSGYALYTPAAGFRDASLNVSLFSSFTKEWSGFAKVGLSRLEGDARNSPISLKPNYGTLTFGASYQFQ